MDRLAAKLRLERRPGRARTSPPGAKGPLWPLVPARPLFVDPPVQMQARARHIRPRVWDPNYFSRFSMGDFKNRLAAARRAQTDRTTTPSALTGPAGPPGATGAPRGPHRAFGAFLRRRG